MRKIQFLSRRLFGFLKLSKNKKRLYNTCRASENVKKAIFIL